MAESVARFQAAPVPGAQPEKISGWLHTLNLRPGEFLERKVTPSQFTNVSFFVTALVAVALHITAWFYGLVTTALGIGFVVAAFYFFLKRAFPFWYITNERVVQITLTPSGTYEEVSVDLSRITSVVKHDPLFGRFFRIQALDVFVAEGSRPKITIRYQQDADPIHTLLSSSRR